MTTATRIAPRIVYAALLAVALAIALQACAGGRDAGKPRYDLSKPKFERGS